MDKEILKKIYEKEEYVQYLRYHPKWYYYLDVDKNNFKAFEATVKKEYKLTTNDQLERMKGQIGFISAMINYWNK